ncbi:hypothetical protein B0G73_105178 [Paraburkholderia sp. BL25I1N1]|nr:hypothetical protein B0G73_105178 [Paraburkholderia sp. BL25I1N1]
MDRKGACACITQLIEHDFRWCYLYPDGKIHDSYKARFEWYDENDECDRSDLIFVKLYVNASDTLVIERFHLDTGKL